MANEELREKNIKKVLQEAIKCFQEFGIENSKISTIAKRSGVDQRSIYRYFSGKEDLVTKATLYFWKQIFNDWDSLKSRPNFQNLTGKEQVQTVLLSHLKRFDEQYVSGFLLVDYDTYIYNKRVDHKQEILDIERRFIQESPLIGAIEKGIYDGTIKTTYKTIDLYKSISYSLTGILKRLAIQYNYYGADINLVLKPQFDIYIHMVLKFFEDGCVG